MEEVFKLYAQLAVNVLKYKIFAMKLNFYNCLSKFMSKTVIHVCHKNGKVKIFYIILLNDL